MFSWWGKLTVYQWSIVPHPSSSVHPFKSMFSETTGPIEVRFYTECLCLAGPKIYIIGPGHMTKVAPCPLYCKKPFENLLHNHNLETWLIAKGNWALQNDDPWLTLTNLQLGQLCSFRLLHWTSLSNIFSSGTTGPIKVWFHMEHLCLMGAKVISLVLVMP